METPPVADEYLHSPEDRRLYNESYYFDFADESVRGFTRLGFQPYEDRANLWVSLVAEGEVYWYRDEDIPISDVFGLNVETPAFEERFRIHEPHSRWSITGEGTGCRSGSPEAVFAGEYSEVPLELDLEFRDPLHEPHSMALHVEDQSHYNHAGRYTGTVTLDGTEFAIDTSGFRDHSWGWFRDWTPGEWGHYWSSLQFDDDSHFLFANQIRPEGGQRGAFGYLDEPDGATPVDSIDVRCEDDLTKDQRAREWAHGNLPDEFVYTVEVGDRTEEIRCTPLGNVPFGFEDRNWELTDPDAPWLTSVVNRMPLEATWESRSGAGWFESSLPLD